ncbi:hypothetical protein QYE76_009715 [Lolium multiflorum]|uniref:Uncharacterized protein n=1 Tax=Lolium multiflorum TaxID=4521 RepID=A0AAD8X171_LOLMU|nr:hypothetical protein QYE76_009715 [Lolium multiflorum]
MTRCCGGDGGVDGGDDDDDDGDDVPLDDDGDGVDFPLREGISPADSCPPESSFLSGVLRPAEAAVTLREELEDLEERVRVTKQLIQDKEALIARSQEEAEGLKAELKTDLAEIRALNKQR